jgi:hypothetical protein
MGLLLEAALVVALSDEAVAVSLRAVEARVERPILDCKRVASPRPRGLHGPR